MSPSAARLARGQRRRGPHRLNRVARRPRTRTPFRRGRRPGRGRRRGRAGVGVLRNAARVARSAARLAGSPCSGGRNRRGPRLLRGRSLRRLGGGGSRGRRGRRRPLRRARRCRCGRRRLQRRGRTSRTFGARVPVGRAAGCAQGDEDRRRVQPSQSRATDSRGSLHCAFFFR